MLPAREGVTWTCARRDHGREGQMCGPGDGLLVRPDADRTDPVIFRACDKRVKVA